MSLITSPYSRNVYAASLPPNFTEVQLRALFAPFGKIISCTAKRDRTTGLCKGYGFILFERDEDACNAVIGLQGHSINFTRIQVRLARPEASAKKVMPVMVQQQTLQLLGIPYYLMMMPQMTNTNAATTANKNTIACVSAADGSATPMSSSFSSAASSTSGAGAGAIGPAADSMSVATAAAYGLYGM